MAQTDVNNAFYRNLAPPGMSEYFISPRVSIQLLLQEGVEVPDNWLHLPDVSPLGSLFLSEDGGKLCSVCWLFCGRLAHGSSPGTFDVWGFNLLRGLR